MRRIAPALTSVALWNPATALGHGPCGCLDPVLVQSGSQVRLTDSAGRQAGGVGYPAYRVIFNPRPADLGIAPGYLASAYRADAPTTTVLSRSPHRPTRRGRFRVPTATPPGLYMVLIFDGSEGGAHNSWDYLHVTDWRDPAPAAVVAEPAPRADARADGIVESAERSGGESGTNWALTVAVGIAGLVLGAALAIWVRRRST